MVRVSAGPHTGIKLLLLLDTNFPAKQVTGTHWRPTATAAATAKRLELRDSIIYVCRRNKPGGALQLSVTCSRRQHSWAVVQPTEAVVF